jgi:alpha-1,2-mannosyltransferase
MLATGDERATLRDKGRAAGLLVLFLIPVVFWRHRLAMPVDFGVYRAGGSAVLHGRTLYGAAFRAHTGTLPLPFTYPPFSAIAFVILAVMPWALAAVLWFLVSVGSLVYIVRESFVEFLKRFDRRRALIALAIIAGLLSWTVPVRDTFWYGQINLILVAMVLADCLRVEKRKGVLVGLATALKLTPGLFVAYFIVTRQKAAAVRSLVTVAVCWGGAALLLPGASKQYWLHDAFNISRPGSPANFRNQTLDGLIYREHWPHWLWIPFVVLVGVFGLWRAHNAHRRGNELAAVVLVGLTAVLVAPISWIHTEVWFVAAIGVIWGDGIIHRRVVAARALFVLVLVRLPMLGDKLERHVSIPLLGGLLDNAYVYLLLVLLVLLPAREALEVKSAPQSMTAITSPS